MIAGWETTPAGGPHSTVASYCEAMTKQRRLRRPPKGVASQPEVAWDAEHCARKGCPVHRVGLAAEGKILCRD